MISTQSHSTRLTVAFAAFLAAVCLPAQAEKPMAEFQAENIAAMAIEYSNDIDRDFASMMIPHHQGAIDMAVAELRYGHNEQLRRIAQEIIVDQLQEITAMRLALSDSLPASSAAATQPDAAAPAGMQRPAPSSTGFKP